MNQLEKKKQELVKNFSSAGIKAIAGVGFDAGVAEHQKLVEPLIENLSKTVAAYREYFDAIKQGEYNNNRRPAPLRDFEDVLQLKAETAIEMLKTYRESTGEK